MILFYLLLGDLDLQGLPHTLGRRSEDEGDPDEWPRLGLGLGLGLGLEGLP